jgi:hypothetical protein
VNPQDSAMSAIGKLEKAHDGFAGQLAEAMEAAGGVAALAAGLESLKEEIAGLWLAISSGGAAPFVETFAQLEGELEAGVWNEGMARLEC